MKVTEEFIKHVAELSKIKLTKKELAEFTKQMQTILDSADIVGEVELTDQNRNKSAGLGLKVSFDELREDRVMPSQSREDALKNAPYTEDGYVKVSGTTFGGVEG